MWSFCRLFVKQRSHITLLRTSYVHKYSILEKKSSDLNWKPRQVLEWVGKPDNLQSRQVQWQECDRHHWTPGNTSIITTNVYFKANSWTAINDHHSCTHFKPLHHVRANCQWWSRSTTGKTNLISQTIVSLSMDTAPISACQLQGDLHDYYGLLGYGLWVVAESAKQCRPPPARARTIWSCPRIGEHALPKTRQRKRQRQLHQCLQRKSQ